MKNDDKFTSTIAVIIVVGIVLLIGMIGVSLEEKECAKYGCDRTVSGSGSYCYVHDTYRSSSYKSSGSSYSSSSASSSSKSSSGSSASSRAFLSLAESLL